ncbi:MAG: TIGR03087 family PEP-CTERM/XrtA system glycosyltransferase [Acidobacteria bacterium]|nr:TIGR03087 family PEP-CTERM/XrtA system glycosyltransferase [Acidobacteriota bacterium]
MEILFLSHCVPNPPDKGEKIRAHFELNELARKHDVHLACFARTPEEIEDARKLVDRCASVYAAPLFPLSLHLARAAVPFSYGACLNTTFYSSGSLRKDVAALLSQRPIRAAFSYSAVAAHSAPAHLPHVLDLVDVDSEKWMQYSQHRWPGLLYRMEAARIRKLEIEQSQRSRITFLSTRPEEQLFRTFAGGVRTSVLENGVDFQYFDPDLPGDPLGLDRRHYVLFVGSMEYFPNQHAVIEFANRVYPALRARDPKLEFLIVGRSPSAGVLALSREPGVTVVGGVDDVRPYYRWARAVMVPLSIARGIQNKVLEALAMNKPVLVSEAVSRTFGDKLPVGVKRCLTPEDYCEYPEAGAARRSAKSRFSWRDNLAGLSEAVDEAARSSR